MGRPERPSKRYHIDFYLGGGLGNGYTSLFRKHVARPFGGGGQGFSFFDTTGLGNIMEFIDEYLPRLKATQKAGYICIFSGNHDTSRLGMGRSFDLAWLSPSSHHARCTQDLLRG
jgi:maltose alpha-D-glucosyltransferase/alpha-amylase